MHYAKDYRLVYQPNDAEQIAVVIPTGEANVQGVKNRIASNVGNVEFHELDFKTYVNVSPKDRILRNAWKFNSTGVIEDIVISKKFIRNKRNQGLVYLDKVAWAESRKPKGQCKLIDRLAQNLRDITKHDSFLSTDILALKGLCNYIDNIFNTVSLDSDIDGDYINNTFFLESSYFEKAKRMLLNKVSALFPHSVKASGYS